MLHADRIVRIAIDAMGGDHGPEPIIEGCVQALQERRFTPILVGRRDEILSYLPLYYQDKIEIVDADDVIGMSDQATNALKRKDSSIYKAIELVRDGKADGVISAGHSGATGSSRFIEAIYVEGQDAGAKAFRVGMNDDTEIAAYVKP